MYVCMHVCMYVCMYIATSNKLIRFLILCREFSTKNSRMKKTEVILCYFTVRNINWNWTDFFPSYGGIFLKKRANRL